MMVVDIHTNSKSPAPLKCHYLLKGIVAFALALFIQSAAIAEENADSIVLAKKQQILRIVGWDVYADPQNKGKTIGYKEFERETGVTIEYTPLNNLDDIINAAESNNYYDVFIISNEGIQILYKMGLVTPIDIQKLPNYQDLYPSLLNKEKCTLENRVCAVPWAWGPTGLLYDTSVMTEPESWNVLWDPRYKGKVSVWDDVSMVWVTALSLGYTNVYNLTREQLAHVKKKLLELNQQVHHYYSGEQDALEHIREGEASILNSWFDPSARLKQEGHHFKMIIPKEGAVGMYDSYLISSASTNIDNIYQFINYQIKPSTQQQMVHITGLAPANIKTLELLEAEEIQSLHLDEEGYFERMLLQDNMPRKHLYEEIVKDVRDDMQNRSSLLEHNEFTDAERSWLKDNLTISFTGDPNWLPYEAFDKNGNYIGIVAEHLVLLEQVTGIKFKVSPSKTWTESTDKARQGLVDVLSETDDSDLKSHLDFTVSYLSNPIVIAMRNNENYVESINKIKDRKIGLIKDYGYAAKIRKKYEDINFITVNDIQDGLLSVSTGKIDALLCTLALCSYTIPDLGLNDVKITGKTEFDTKLAFGVQKNLPQLLSILNKAISKISTEQQQAILDKWIKNKMVENIDYTLIYQIIALSIFVVSLLVLWNYRLTKEVNLRISAEKDLRDAQEILRFSHQRLLSHHEHSPLAVIEWDTDFKVVSWNKAAESIFGYSKEEALGRHAVGLIVPESVRDEVSIIWDNLLKKSGGERHTNENITRDGRTVLCEWYNTPLKDQFGNVIGVASLADDITERKSSEEMIWKQANYDTLTGLPNRNMFHDRLSQEINKSKRAGLSLALLLVDLDEFKEVNDTLGHDAGDLLLQEAAHRISECIRGTDTVSRLGGDEFTIILSELPDNTKVENIAQLIINRLSEVFYINGETVHVSGSVGITMFPDDATSIEVLMKNADQAMYAAKKKGRNRFSYFTKSLQDAAQARLRLTNALRLAVAENQFKVYFQPIINLTTGRIVKAEALLRWSHPERGIISPLEFIPLAEETGLINNIGDWVFKESARWAKQWSQQFDEDFQVSVNMSPVQFKSEQNIFTTDWAEFCQEFEMCGKNIVVEITEGLLLHAEPEVIDKLLWLRDAGIQVAVDDFGTGYSSLAYLKKFDIDYLKIDQSFTRNLKKGSDDLALSEAIIKMAHTLGLNVIAEGVETEEQKQLLAELGCDYAQGYLYSKPVPADELEVLLESQQTE